MDPDLASATLPPEEEEPGVLSYAAAEVFVLEAGCSSRTQTTTAEELLVCSRGGGTVLRMCLCLQADAVWKRRQKDVAAVVVRAFGGVQRLS